MHGTTGEAPNARLEREEAAALRPLNGCPPFRQLRELTPRVQNDACVDVDTNHYSVPWKLIGAQVNVMVDGGQIRIHHAGIKVACHDKRLGRRERAVDRVHLHGIVPCRPSPVSSTDVASAAPTTLPGIELLRVRAGRGRQLVTAEVDALPDMLVRLKLMAMRDRLAGPLN